MHYVRVKIKFGFRKSFRGSHKGSIRSRVTGRITVRIIISAGLVFVSVSVVSRSDQIL